MSKKLKKPGKLKITRDNTTFTFSWTNPKADKKHYGYTKCIAKIEYYKKNSKGEWTKKSKSFGSVSHSAGTHSKSFKIEETKSVKFYIKAYHKKKKTGWKTKQWKASKPQSAEELAPDLNADEFDSTHANRSKFSWTIEGASHTNRAWCTDIIFQTAFTKETEADDPDNVKFTTTFTLSRNAGSGVLDGAHYDIDDETASGSIYWDEADVYTDNIGYIRWLRIRASGPGGKSQYSDIEYVVYCTPDAPNMSDVTAVNASSGEIHIGVSSSVGSDTYYNMVDNVKYEYAITTPTANMKAPLGTNPSESLSLGPVKNGIAKFDIPSQLTANQALFIRSSSTYNGRTTESDWTLVKKLEMFLADAGLSGTIDPDYYTHKVRLEPTNNSTEIARTNTELGAFVVIYFKQGSETEIPIGIFKQGDSAIDVGFPKINKDSSGNANSFAFGVRSMVAVGWNPDSHYETKTDRDSESSPEYSYRVYNLPTPDMQSTNINWREGDIPKAPTGVKTQATASGACQVTWNWSWPSATDADISWAEYKDSWESTNEPDVYRIASTRASRWNVYGLESGTTWYIRVRLIKSTESTELLGPWSEITSNSTFSLISAPKAPDLILSKSVVSLKDKITASWSYISTDTTEQKSATIKVVTFDENGDKVYGDTVVSVKTKEQKTTLNIAEIAKTLQWSTGNTYGLAICTTSESMQTSEYSAVRTLRIANPISCQVTLPTGSNGFTQVNVTKTVENEDGTMSTVTVTEKRLVSLPMSIKVSGAGSTGTTSITIKRKDSYEVERPDESDFNGFIDEIVCYHQQDGDAVITLDRESFTGPLDDNGDYYIEAIVTDEIGQTAYNLDFSFKVAWSHQAVIPSAEAVVDQDEYISLIMPIAPSGYAEEGDTCDIYRLSSDKPQLIVQGGEFGTVYVDPYPAIGPNGGHRVVFVSKYGDFIDANGNNAWVDTDLDVYDPEDEYYVGDTTTYHRIPYTCTAETTGPFDRTKWDEDWDCDYFQSIYTIIDFDDTRIRFLYNVDLSNSWQKDFKETRYLGGHIQGDWNPGVSRTTTINTVTVLSKDDATISAMRRLADYPGICHIRTTDGSSFPADVQVSETRNYSDGELVTYSLSVTRVDSESLDGMTLSEWEEGE